MKNAVRIALSATALCAGLAFVGASTASGQVFFRGNFPAPHGRISVRVGGPAFAVGAYVPSPYVDQIEYLPDYGYGFYCDEGWVPVRRYGSGWVVYQRPFFIERGRLYGYRGYNRFNRFDRGGRFDRFDRNRDRRFDRFDRNRGGRIDRYDRNRGGRSDRYDRDRRGNRDRRH
jgi:hypothetical protein